jgi:hypothetical protein
MNLNQKLDEFNKGYASGMGVIEVHLKARQLNVEQLEDLENYSWLESLSIEYSKSVFMVGYVLQEGTKSMNLGMVCSFINNPIEFYRGMYFYNKKDKK